MFSSSERIRREAFFTLWKDALHPITELPEDIKRWLYPQLRGCLLVDIDALLSSSDNPVWVERGRAEVSLCSEQDIGNASWLFDGTQVHAFIVHKTALILWVDIEYSIDCKQLIDIVQIQLEKKEKSEAYVSTWRLIIRFGREKLRDRGTYIVALFVGTLITGYGQFLVPYLRNEGDVLGVFIDNVRTHPKLSTFSILLAYFFPIAVQIQATIVAQVKAYRKKRELFGLR